MRMITIYFCALPSMKQGLAPSSRILPSSYEFRSARRIDRCCESLSSQYPMQAKLVNEQDVDVQSLRLELGIPGIGFVI
jgi:hypothetical protein